MKLEWYLAFDAEGGWGIGNDEQEAVENYKEDNDVNQAISVVKLELEIEKPAPLALSAVVPFSVTTEIIKLEVARA